MFDDQLPTSQGGVPPNLPIGEPEDLFGTVDPVIDVQEDVPAHSFVSATNPSMSIHEGQMAQNTADNFDTGLPSAVSAGKLQPKEYDETDAIPLMPSPTVGSAATVSTMSSARMSTMPADLHPSYNTLGAAPSSMAVEEMKSPNFMRTIITVGIIVIVAIIIGGGGWYLVSGMLQNRTPNPTPTIDVVEIPLEDDTNPSDNIQPTTDTTIPAAEAPAAIPLPIDDTLSPRDVVDNQILFGDDIDIDEDGLSDSREIEFATDPRNWDTDGDELSDGDEVLNWGTDPLNPDTDEDGFFDGDEVKSGYSPLVGGGARLFEAAPPTTSGNTTDTTL